MRYLPYLLHVLRVTAAILAALERFLAEVLDLIERPEINFETDLAQKFTDARERK
jgi:hypothetical protein